MRYRKLYNYIYKTDEEYSGYTGIPGEVDTVYIKLKDGDIWLKKGYAWNGVSYFPDLKSMKTASLVHDAFYQLIREELIPYSQRRPVDRFFWMMCVDAGMKRPLANTTYRFLRMFGARAARPGRIMHPNRVFEAP